MIETVRHFEYMQCNLFIDHIFVLPPDTIQAGTTINELGAPTLATGLSIYVHQEQNVAPLRIDSERSKRKILLACVSHSPCPSDAWTSNDRARSLLVHESDGQGKQVI